MDLLWKKSPDNQIPPGQLIKQELKERHLSQKFFAEAIGVRASHLTEMIKGTRKVPANIIPKISEFLGVPDSLLVEFQTTVETRKKCEALKSDEEIDADNFLRELDEIVSVKSLCKTLGIRVGIPVVYFILKVEYKNQETMIIINKEDYPDIFTENEEMPSEDIPLFNQELSSDISGKEKTFLSKCRKRNKGSLL